jgi:hypothetical protein
MYMCRGGPGRDAEPKILKSPGHERFCAFVCTYVLSAPDKVIQSNHSFALKTREKESLEFLRRKENAPFQHFLTDNCFFNYCVRSAAGPLTIHIFVQKSNQTKNRCNVSRSDLIQVKSCAVTCKSSLCTVRMYVCM